MVRRAADQLVSPPITGLTVRRGYTLKDVAGIFDTTPTKLVRALEKHQPSALGRTPDGNYFVKKGARLEFKELVPVLNATRATKGSGLWVK